MKGKEGRGLEKGNKNTNGQDFDLEQCIMILPPPMEKSTSSRNISYKGDTFTEEQEQSNVSGQSQLNCSCS